jgi:hypothetical protein
VQPTDPVFADMMQQVTLTRSGSIDPCGPRGKFTLVCKQL